MLCSCPLKGKIHYFKSVLGLFCSHLTLLGPCRSDFPAPCWMNVVLHVPRGRTATDACCVCIWRVCYSCVCVACVEYEAALKTAVRSIWTQKQVLMLWPFVLLILAFQRFFLNIKCVLVQNSLIWFHCWAALNEKTKTEFDARNDEKHLPQTHEAFYYVHKTRTVNFTLHHLQWEGIDVLMVIMNSKKKQF